MELRSDPLISFVRDSESGDQFGKLQTFSGDFFPR